MAEHGGYGPGWVVAPTEGWVAPKGRTPDGRVLAEGGRRVLGLLVDVAIWAVPQILATVGAVVAFLLSIPDEASGEEASTAGIVVAVVLYLLVFLLIFVRIAVEAEKVARSGQTWGMKALQLRAVDSRTGGPVTRGRAWGRALFAGFISGQLAGLGYWWSFFDDRNRTLHDLVCHTVVIDERHAAGAGLR